jgi:hypothetical protein
VRAQTAAQRDASSISNAALTTSDGGASAGASVDRAARAYCCTLRRSPVAVAGFTIRRDSRSPIGVSPRGISTRPSKDLSPRPSRDHPQAASRRRAARLKQRVRAGAQLILPHLRCRKDLWRRFARGAQGALEARPAEGRPGVLGSGVKCQRWPVASMDVLRSGGGKGDVNSRLRCERD